MPYRALEITLSGRFGRKALAWFCFTLSLAAPWILHAETLGLPQGAASIQADLERLNVLGSVLMIAAHPDDENTALLAWFARGRKFRTGYLSLTRGEGGQNLIGPERGPLLGIIRTQELLAARRLDGASQWFTRAIDFGFSKSAEESLSFWGREQILADTVWVIRRFQPDVIVLRFSGTPRDGHGQHQASAILGKEAFHAAADPARFPEQLRYVQPWQATRLMFNLFSFTRQMEREAAATSGRLAQDLGAFEPLLGCSYGEIAGMSRSMHRSQGMGSPQRKGSLMNFLTVVAGQPAAEDPFDGIDTSWNRVPGGAPLASVLAGAVKAFEPRHPERSIPVLLRARRLLAGIDHPWAKSKLAELDDLLARCAGLWLDASGQRHSVVPGAKLSIQITAINRSSARIQLEGVQLQGAGNLPAVPLKPGPLNYNQPLTAQVEWVVPANQPLSQPYWMRRRPGVASYVLDDQQLVGLAENQAEIVATFRLRFDDQLVTLSRPVIHRWVDRVAGEQTRPIAVVPPLSVRFAGQGLIFADAAPKPLEVLLQSAADDVAGDLAIQLPPGWQAKPASQPFRLPEEGRQLLLRFQVQPPAAEGSATARAVATVHGSRYSSAITVINYPHFPPQSLLLPAEASLVRVDAKVLARRVGYVMGAGDEIPQALRQLGVEVVLLGEEDLAGANLDGFDAILTGVRAYNVRDDLRANQHRLLDYVSRGGVLIVQYNVLEGGFGSGDSSKLDHIGPYPIQISRSRVSVETAPVEFLAPDHFLMTSPNRITAGDFQGWVQERGLYFASRWDPRYQPLWQCHDPGEAPLAGGTLVARHGRGVYIFTAFSWFRQLPAGVPGSFRIFANFLSAGKLKQ